jgi:hypothetical protein
MSALESLSWQAIPASTLLASGTPLLLVGLWREWEGLRRPLRDPNKVFTWVRGFRLSMIGLALAGSGAGWIFVRPGSSCCRSQLAARRPSSQSIMHFALTRDRDLRITVRR